ncbi:hypothetical protein [Streptomyces sp. CB01881]|uniref:hypothetical protein n=1 Tax=Streptomyces sp. CB01881 TaxID=2078691 RepID=UPI000CDC3541|nr:hypothetical protein [Streptomyces sp. CB01881]AUY51263.1 hypothetical protein C2142_22595 [Streptomyces sp. CB01881]TYC74649.1 hypothetical protein EH183_22570 [Streptomyces sp. CB01881]
MNLIDFTHVVTRAGAAFGFAVMAITAMALYYSNGRTVASLKRRAVWLPWVGPALTMVLASAVTGGVIGKISGGFTGTGNKAGQAVGHVGIGQDGAGAVDVSTGEVLSYSGSWLVLVLVVGVALFIWFAKSWKERALAVSGALTGATWGIASSIGGWAAMVGVPLVSWIGELVIG